MLTRFLLLGLLLVPGTGWAVQLGTDDCSVTGNLGANWTVVTGFDLPQGTPGVCQSKTNTVLAAATYTAVGWANDQWAQIKVVTASTSTARIVGTLLRYSNAARTGYECQVIGPLGATTTLTIYRFNAGTPTSLATTGASTTVASGDTAYCEIQGSTLIMKLNGVQKLSVTDGTPIASGGAGMMVFVTGTVGQAQLDDWVGGDFTSGAAVQSMGLGWLPAVMP